MTQEQKDLLLKDLCARLLYGVKIALKNNGAYHHENIAKKGDVTIEILKGFNGNYFSIRHTNPLDWDWYDDDIDIEDIKPYLFPLSSMTEEQRIELYKVLGWRYESHYHLSKEWEDFNNSIDNNDLFIPASWVSDLNKMYNWFNKNHFDYRGLIPMDLAIDATGKNIY